MEMLVLEIRYITQSDDGRVISKIYEESWKYAYQHIEIMLDYDMGKVVTLGTLTPEWWI